MSEGDMFFPLTTRVVIAQQEYARLKQVAGLRGISLTTLIEYEVLEKMTDTFNKKVMEYGTVDSDFMERYLDAFVNFQERATIVINTSTKSFSHYISAEHTDVDDTTE